MYNDYVRSDISVNRTWYDSNNTATTRFNETAKAVYEITLVKLISGKSVSNIMPITSGTQASVAVKLPSDVQLSGPPISGKWRFKCLDSEGYTSYSSDMVAWEHPFWV